MYDPAKGPLSNRIERGVVDEQNNDEISIVETAYWFHEPPNGGWPRRERIPVAPAMEGEFPSPRHERDLDRRFPLALLEEGLELDGVVSDVWLHHGAQVDFVGEWDGLVPLTPDEWRAAGDDLLPGTVVRVRVHRLRDPKLYRWPVQLALVDPALAAKATPPDEYEPGAHVGALFDAGLTLEEAAATLGRAYAPSRYLLEADHAEWAERAQYEYGWREPDINGYAGARQFMRRLACVLV